MRWRNLRPWASSMATGRHQFCIAAMQRTSLGGGTVMLSVTWRSSLRHSAAIAVLVASGLISFGAQAQTRTFNLRAQDAVRAIPEFARQAGIQILAPADE